MSIYKYQEGMTAAPQISPEMLSEAMSAQGAGQGIDYNGNPTPNVSGAPSFADMAQEIHDRYDKLIIPLQQKLEKLQKKLEENPSDQTIKNEMKRLEQRIDHLEQQEDMELQQLEAEVERTGQQIEQEKQIENGIDMPVPEEGAPEYQPLAEQQMPQEEGMPMMQGGGFVKSGDRKFSKHNPELKTLLKEAEKKRIENQKEAYKNYGYGDVLSNYIIETKGDNDISNDDILGRGLQVVSPDKRMKPKDWAAAAYNNYISGKYNLEDIQYKKGDGKYKKALDKTVKQNDWQASADMLAGKVDRFANNTVKRGDYKPLGYMMAGLETLPMLAMAPELLGTAGAAIEKGIEYSMPSAWMNLFGMPASYGAYADGALMSGLAAKAITDEVTNGKNLSPLQHVMNAAMIAPVAKPVAKGLGEITKNGASRLREHMGEFNPQKVVEAITPDGQTIRIPANTGKWDPMMYYNEANAGYGIADDAAKTTNTAAEIPVENIPSQGNASGNKYENGIIEYVKETLKKPGALQKETVHYGKDGEKRTVVDFIELDGDKFYITSKNKLPKYANKTMNFINRKTGGVSINGNDFIVNPNDEGIKDLKLSTAWNPMTLAKNAAFLLHPHISQSLTKGQPYSVGKYTPAGYGAQWRGKNNIEGYDKLDKWYNLNIGKRSERKPYRYDGTTWGKIGNFWQALGNNARTNVTPFIANLGYLGRDAAVPAGLLTMPKIWGGWNLYDAILSPWRDGSASDDASATDTYKPEGLSDSSHIENEEGNVEPPDTTSHIIDPNIQGDTKWKPSFKQSGGMLKDIMKNMSEFPVTDYMSIGSDIAKVFDDFGRHSIEAKKNLQLPSNNLWSVYDKAERDYRDQQNIDYNNYQLNKIKSMRQQAPIGEYGSLHMNNMARILDERLKQEQALNNEKTYNAAVESTNKTLGNLSQDAYKNALERDSELSIARRNVLDQYYKDLNINHNAKIAANDNVITRMSNMANQINKRNEIWNRYYPELRNSNISDELKRFLLGVISTTYATPEYEPEKRTV